MLSDNGTYEQWSEEGATWQHERANHQWKQLLDEYEPPPMGESALEELEEFIERRLRQIRNYH